MRLGKIAHDQENKRLKLAAKQTVSEFMIMQNLLFYVSSRHNPCFFKAKLEPEAIWSFDFKTLYQQTSPKVYLHRDIPSVFA